MKGLCLRANPLIINAATATEILENKKKYLHEMLKLGICNQQVELFTNIYL